MRSDQFSGPPDLEPPKKLEWWVQYKGAYDILGQYWLAYGGWREICLSPYAALGLILTLVGLPSWWDGEWWDVAISALPDLLGFSLGAYAMLVGLGDSRFRQILSSSKASSASSNKASSASLYTIVSASFAHFIVVQALALVVAVVAKALFFIPSAKYLVNFVREHSCVVTVASRIWWCLGYFLFMYALALVVATAMAVFRLVKWSQSSEPSVQSSISQQRASALEGTHPTGLDDTSDEQSREDTIGVTRL